MKIGSMRQRITFQEGVKTPDGYKGHTITWQPVCVVWASVDPLSGREYFYGHQIKAEVSHRVRIRYNDKINAEMRINYGGRYFEIESIIDLKERHEVHEILVKETK